MNFVPEAIREFCQIWQEEFGETITPEAADIRANEVMELFRALAEKPTAGVEPSTKSQ